MRRADPATNLADRAIRQWQLRESIAVRHEEPETQSTPTMPEVSPHAGISAVTVGSVAGFLGAMTSLLLNIGGAFLLGIEPLHLLRIYATIIEGRAALDMSRSDFFVSALTLHVVTGVLFGVVFAVGSRKFCCSGPRRYILAGAGYGIAVWLVNFYGILSWLQPLLYGRPFILTEIPIAVAVLTHVSYSLTVAFVTYPFQFTDWNRAIEEKEK